MIGLRILFRRARSRALGLMIARSISRALATPTSTAVEVVTVRIRRLPFLPDPPFPCLVAGRVPVNFM